MPRLIPSLPLPELLPCWRRGHSPDSGSRTAAHSGAPAPRQGPRGGRRRRPRPLLPTAKMAAPAPPARPRSSRWRRLYGWAAQPRDAFNRAARDLRREGARPRRGRVSDQVTSAPAPALRPLRSAPCALPPAACPLPLSPTACPPSPAPVPYRLPPAACRLPPAPYPPPPAPCPAWALAPCGAAGPGWPGVTGRARRGPAASGASRSPLAAAAAVPAVPGSARARHIRVLGVRRSPPGGTRPEGRARRCEERAAPRGAGAEPAAGRALRQGSGAVPVTRQD